MVRLEKRRDGRQKIKNPDSKSCGSIRTQVLACYIFLSLDTLHYLNVLNLTDTQFQKKPYHWKALREDLISVFPLLLPRKCFSLFRLSTPARIQVENFFLYQGAHNYESEDMCF